MGMNRLELRLLTLGTLSALGCTGGAEVLLGHAPSQEDSGVEGASGDAGAPEAPAPDVLAERICDADFAGRPRVELRIQVRDPSCSRPCSLQLDALRIADDGSVWVAGSMDGRARLSIGHYDAAGNQLGSAAVDNFAAPARLALDDSGHAWLLANQASSHLHRFDASVHELEMHVLPGQYSELIRYPGHGVLLSGTSRPLVALSDDGEELWTAASGTLTAGRPAVADDGRIVLGTASRARVPSLTLHWLSDGGDALLPTANTSIAVEGSWGFARTFDLAFTDAGLTIVSEVPRPREVTGGYLHRPEARVTHVDTAGSTQWRWLVDTSGDLASTVDPATGTTLVAGPDSSIVAIAPDGASCRRFAFDGPDLLGQLAVGPGGEIWFGGLDFSQEDVTSSVGRLARPDLNW